METEIEEIWSMRQLALPRCSPLLLVPFNHQRIVTDLLSHKRHSSCIITTVMPIFGDLVLNRAELCSLMNLRVLISRLHVRGQLSSRVGNYLNSRLVRVRCHLTSRPSMIPRDVNS
jgi:hypothetical protein